MAWQALVEAHGYAPESHGERPRCKSASTILATPENKQGCIKDMMADGVPASMVIGDVGTHDAKHDRKRFGHEQRHVT